MALDASSVGKETGPRDIWWNPSHCLLYALSVGSDADELQFVTENTEGSEQRVIPTFACVAGGAQAFAQSSGEQADGLMPAGEQTLDLGFGEVQLGDVLHGEQAVELLRPLPTAARVKVWTKIVSIWDKGHAAVVRTESRGHVSDTGELLYKVRQSLFVRGEGGFGGERGPSATLTGIPQREPDEQVTYLTSRTQNLLYRLNGDRSPLHSDPTFARRAGFDHPILHGMCTYGFSCRALVQCLCGGDASRFISMSGRFAHHVLPGDELIVKIWVDGGDAVFTTETQHGKTAISHGRFTFVN